MSRLILIGVVADTLCWTGAAHAQNRLVNPNFDKNVQGWKSVSQTLLAKR